MSLVLKRIGLFVLACSTTHCLVTQSPSAPSAEIKQHIQHVQSSLLPAVVVKDRISRYAADAERRTYLDQLARGNEETAARLRAGARGVRADSPVGNGSPTSGDKASETEGFSSYSPVGHYVPDVVEEETQRG